jgi:hypothetical protein
MRSRSFVARTISFAAARQTSAPVRLRSSRDVSAYASSSVRIARVVSAAASARSRARDATWREVWNSARRRGSSRANSSARRLGMRQGTPLQSVNGDSAL